MPNAALPALGQVASAVQAFDEGTRLLEEGAYSAAIARFDETEGTGFVSPALYYNRGIAHFRMDELGLSIRDFERARRLDPQNELIQHSLDIARSRIDQPISSLPRSLTARFWGWLGRSPWVLFVWGALSYLLFISFSIADTRGVGSADWMRRVRWMTGGGALFFLLAAFASSAVPPEAHQAVITAPDTAVFAQADPASDRAAVVSEGITVRIEKEEGAWILVQLPNGVTGWLAAGAVASI
jgi:tetratricopeptide (TPR) repeat protein